MKNFKFLLVAAIMLTGFASCSSDEATTDNGNAAEKNVFFKLATGTYGEGPAIADNTTATFNDGDLYFVSANGTIVKHMTLGRTAGTNNIPLVNITAGVAIPNVPSDAIKVYVVANKSGLTTTTGDNISAVEATVLTIESQTNTNYDLSQVTLHGTAPITGTAPSFSAAVSIAPLISRIELGNITATTPITGYMLEGIFISGFYTKMAFSAVPDVANFVAKSINNADFVGGTAPYLANYPLFDYSATGLGGVPRTTLVKAPTAGKVWAYNVFSATAVPSVVIRLSDITTASAMGGTQFITIKGFRDGSNNLLTSLAPGFIYKIAAGSLTFNDTNVDLIPNKTSIEVTVTVTPINWKVTNITPEI